MTCALSTTSRAVTRWLGTSRTPGDVPRAQREALVRLDVDDQRLAGRAEPRAASPRSALVLRSAVRQRVDHDQRAGRHLRASAARSAPRRPSSAGRSRSCAAAARTRAALAPQRVADLADAGAAGALLAPRLLAAAADFRAGLGRVGAATLARRSPGPPPRQISSVFTRPPKTSSFSSRSPTFSFCPLTTLSCISASVLLLALAFLTRRPSTASRLRCGSGLRGDRPAHDHVAARRAGDRAVRPRSRLFSASTDDLRLRTVTRSPPMRPGARMPLTTRDGIRRGADRAGRAVEHRAVGRRAAGEVVALHDALETLAAAGADHVDPVAVVEHAGDQHLSRPPSAPRRP